MQIDTYKHIFEHAPDATVICGSDGLIAEVNRQAELLFGYTREELVGRPVEILLPARYAESHVGHRERFMASSSSRPMGSGMRVLGRRKDGSEFYSDTMLSTTDSDQGRIAVAIVRDVTERRQSEERIRESEAFLRSLLETAPDIILTLDRAGKILFINRTMPPLTPDQVIGTTCFDYVPPETRDRVAQAIRHVFETGKFDEYETLGPPLANGLRACYFVRVGPIQEQGRISAVTMCATDITARKQAEDELKLAMQRLSLATQSANIAIWDWDVESNVLTWDDRMYALYGIRPQDFSGAYLAWENGLHPDDLVRMRAETQEALSGTRDFHTEFRVVWPGGEIRHIEGHALVQRSASGAARRMIGVNWDITERMQAQEELSAAKSQVDSLLDRITDDVVSLDEQWRYAYINASAAKSHRKTPPEILGRSIWEVFPDLVGTVFWDKYHECMKTQQPVAFEAHYGGFDNWVSVRAYPSRNGLTVFYRDISEQKRAEAALNLAEKRVHAIVQTVPDFLCTLDQDGRFIFINRLAPGFQLDRVIGHTIYEFTVPSYHETMRNALQRVAGENQVVEIENEGFGPLGEVRWYMSRIAPLQMAGSAEKIVLVATDITERKRLEAQLLQAQKVESIGRLAGGVAHDFNNLLTSIVGFAELAKVGLPKDARNVQNLNRVLESANRGATLTQQLLAFARKRIVKPEVLDLNQVIEGMVPMLKRLIGEDLEFAFIPGEKLDRIRIDPGSVEQVVMNLAVNARDAMPAGGTLTLETQNVLLDRAYAARHVDVAPGPYVMLSVTDTGAGMSKDVLTKIFEPFFTTKPVGKGTGLGLATCHGIVTQAAGHISVTSEKGKGACFKVYLPRMKDAPPAAAVKRPVAEPKGGQETILAVEDDDLIRDFLGQTLRGLGYKVHLAANGEEALRLCEDLKEPVHLLLTDVVMPKMSGRDLAAILQARQRNLKVLFASGYTEDDTIRKGELNASMDFIQKPYNSTSLAAQIRGILDR